ncbi:MAG TPA: DUF58 domain-containing protein [Anaerolineaceae bacterium]
MTIRGVFWVVLILLIGSYAGAILTDSILFYRLVYLTGGILVVSFLWSLFAVAKLSVRRSERVHRHQVGQVFEERFEINNRFPFFRLWIEVLDQCPLPGKAGSRVLSWIGGNQKRAYISYTQLHTRGLFPLGPTTLISGDPFGFFRVKRVFKEKESLLVLPYVEEIEKFSSPPGVLPGGRAIRRRTPESTPQAAGVREYMPGDSLNRIHWPITVKRDRLMVKEFEQDPHSDVWIIIDGQESVHRRSANPYRHSQNDLVWWRSFNVEIPADTFEYSMTAAGSIANYYIKQGRAVGVICDGQIQVAITAERGERQLNKILDSLAYLEPKGETSISSLVEAQTRHLPRGSTIVLITPSTAPIIEITYHQLQQKSLWPVFVYIDGDLIASDEDNKNVRKSNTIWNIPVIRISSQDTIKQELERGPSL